MDFKGLIFHIQAGMSETYSQTFHTGISLQSHPNAQSKETKSIQFNKIKILISGNKKDKYKLLTKIKT
jgi:hypothetical protein